jgi:hypothetical protein
VHVVTKKDSCEAATTHCAATERKGCDVVVPQATVSRAAKDGQSRVAQPLSVACADDTCQTLRASEDTFQAALIEQLNRAIKVRYCSMLAGQAFRHTEFLQACNSLAAMITNRWCS